MYNISVTCGEIQTDGGFEFNLPSDSLNQTLNPDCEQSWHSEDGRLIAVPSDPQRMIDPVISVSSDRLITSHCVNLKHEIICDSTGSPFSREIMFRVRNETAVTPNSDDLNEVTLQHSDQSLLILAVFLIVILIIILICFLWRKKKLGCFLNVFRRDDSENRNPETGVQMQLRSDDDPDNHLEMEPINCSDSDFRSSENQKNPVDHVFHSAQNLNPP
ncbi:uncharacterized protein LOC127161613 isoform X1 [Labeo rohita]|uniref:uncharacterized protein LOC127161613 isoform X1 n=1 Tax=Labeo rohita TaxID=84645 RepID=UPI0021E2548B|nr:uncharacterized protein LOC127161613 isoform X1 [Labeo rohita]XP_050960300.1 uncharacterized protein LOC127161613 isoform X1 [Labeo rohita]XP_050960301.1 uncharacterized protein LOC127161613 isoform X1 [Labeo rohita]